MMRKWHPDDGFRVYSERDERFLTGEEIDASCLFMKHDGSLIRVEVYIDEEGKPIRYPRTPRDLSCVRRIILDNWKKR